MDIKTIYRNELYFKKIFNNVAFYYITTNKLSKDTSVYEAWYHANTQGYQNLLTIFENNEYNTEFYKFKDKSILMEAQSIKFDWEFYININNIENKSNELDAAKHWHFIGKKQKLQISKISTDNRKEQKNIKINEQLNELLNENKNKIDKQNAQMVIELETMKIHENNKRDKIQQLNNQKLQKLHKQIEDSKNISNIEQTKLEISIRNNDELIKQNETKQMNIMESTIYEYTQSVLQDRLLIKQEEEEKVYMAKNVAQMKNKEVNDKLIDFINNLEDTIGDSIEKEKELCNSTTLTKYVVNNLKTLIN